jgi:excisionase family DNA binding protein
MTSNKNITDGGRQRLYTTAEVARLWNADQKTISRWADTGELPSIRTPGGHRRFTEATVREHVGFLGGDTYLTTAEVAAIFRVSPKTVRGWAETGKLPCIRTVGGQRRFRESEIRALIEGGAS